MTPASVVAARPDSTPCVVDSLELALLNSFELRSNGAAVPLPLSAQRLLAFLALRDHPMLRVHVAGTLWIDATEDRAFASLRSTLWRLQQPGHRVVEVTNQQLRLARGLRVDLHDATASARGLIDGTGNPDAILEPLVFTGELLPDWYDDWVLIERERYRQLGLHALEILADRLTVAGRYGEATDAALAAVAGEPMRESAHRVLIRVYLAEGNPGEAIRQYRFYRQLVRDRLGLEPSPQIDGLVAGLTA